jgi:hypothetical protein
MGRQPLPDEGGNLIDAELNHDRVRTRKHMLYQCDISSVALSRHETYCIAALLL